MKFYSFIVALLAISTILFTIEASPVGSGFLMVFSSRDLRVYYRNKVRANLFKNVKFICDDKPICGSPSQVAAVKKEITDHVINILKINFNNVRYVSLKDIE